MALQGDAVQALQDGSRVAVKAISANKASVFMERMRPIFPGESRRAKASNKDAVRRARGGIRIHPAGDPLADGPSMRLSIFGHLGKLPNIVTAPN